MFLYYGYETGRTDDKKKKSYKARFYEIGSRIGQTAKSTSTISTWSLKNGIDKDRMSYMTEDYYGVTPVEGFGC